MPTPRETVARAYELLAARDLDGYLALLHPDVVITQDPALPWGGEHVGADGAATFAITLVSHIDSRVTILELFEAGNHVVQYGRTAGTVNANGARFDLPETHVWTVADGLITRAQFYIDTAAMLAALRGEPAGG